MANRIPRVPVREQEAKVRATNFEEVCYGYDEKEAVLEASRCLNCKNPLRGSMSGEREDSGFHLPCRCR